MKPKLVLNILRFSRAHHETTTESFHDSLLGFVALPSRNPIQEVSLMQTEQFVLMRPYVYHLTDRNNLGHIRVANALSPAAYLMEQARRCDLMRSRRHQHEKIRMGNTVVLIRDQMPLRKGHIELLDGYSYEDVIESINRRVFFWAGTDAGPIAQGVRHFGRYRTEHPVILRVSFRSLLQLNPHTEPKFCRYNSGSPRTSNRKKSPRGPDTFMGAETFDGTASAVVEVTFEEPIMLPSDTMVGKGPKGPWQGLCESRAAVSG